MQKKKELSVAVILITFNQENFILEALDGIRNQSRTPDQVIVADDGSSDDTQKLILEYVQRFNLADTWELLLSTHNRGINENLDGAIALVKSDIILPMAGDDISLPNRCAHAIRIFNLNLNVNIINTNGLIIDQCGQLIKKTNRPMGLLRDIRSSIRKGFPPMSPVGECWRASMFKELGRLPRDVPNEDDQISFYGLISGGIYCDSEVTFKYRIHSQSASAWLHKNQSSYEFLNRFLMDMHIREKHMLYWEKSLLKFDNKEYFYLANMAHTKARLYKLLGEIGSSGWLKRVCFCIENPSILTLREFIYIFFGKYGVIGWRLARRLAGRNI